MLNKEMKIKILNQIDVISNWNDKLADFYTKPKSISDIRSIIFNEIIRLRKLIN